LAGTIVGMVTYTSTASVRLGPRVSPSTSHSTDMGNMEMDVDLSDDLTWPCEDISGLTALVAGFNQIPVGVACHVFHDNGLLTDLHADPSLTYQDMVTSMQTNLVPMMDGLRHGWIRYSGILPEVFEQYVDCCANIESCVCTAAGTCDMVESVCMAFYFAPQTVVECFDGTNADCFTCVQDSIAKCDSHNESSKKSPSEERVADKDASDQEKEEREIDREQAAALTNNEHA